MQYYNLILEKQNNNMFNKMVVLNVFCSKSICELKVISCSGYLIKNVNINSLKTKVCITTRDQKIFLQAKYKGQTIYQTIFINNYCHQNIFTSFNFNRAISLVAICTIQLSDANYGLPIPTAMLNFKSVNKK